MEQARIWNPRSPIYLITDQPAQNYPGVMVVPVSSYAESAVEFQKHYVHMSSNPVELELVCLQRWLVLSELLKQLPYTRCFVMDSDVLLYSDLTEVHRRYAGYDFTLTHQSSPGECFFDVPLLHTFAQLVMETFREKRNYAWYLLQAIYRHTVDSGSPGGISDMPMLNIFSQGYAGRWLDTMHIVEDATFDHHVNTGVPGFEMEGGRKKITWIHQQPYGFHLKQQRLIRFLSLHFQGGAKFLIERCRRDPSPESLSA